MYNHRIRLAPALGKAPEARRLLVDHVKHLQGQGQRLALSERILSSEGPTLLVTHMAAEIAEVERVRRSRLTDADFQARAGQVVALLSEPPRASLWESVVEPLPNPGPVTIGQFVFFHPAIGKQRQLEELLSEVVTQLRQIGQRTTLWRRIYSSEGPMFQTVSLYTDLADLDQARKASTALRERNAAGVAELSRAQVQRRLVEILIPFPQA